MEDCILCTPIPPPMATGLLPHEVATIGRSMATFGAVVLAICLLMLVIGLSLLIVTSVRD